MAGEAGAAAKKKSLHASEQDRPDVKAARDAWHDQLKDVPTEKLVFLDESGAKTNMTRTHGRAPRGVRVVDKVPHGHWRTTTMISAVRTAGPFAAAVVSGATDTDVFLAYVEHALVPELRAGERIDVNTAKPERDHQPAGQPKRSKPTPSANGKEASA